MLHSSYLVRPAKNRRGEKFILRKKIEPADACKTSRSARIAKHIRFYCPEYVDLRTDSVHTWQTKRKKGLINLRTNEISYIMYV